MDPQLAVWILPLSRLAIPTLVLKGKKDPFIQRPVLISCTFIPRLKSSAGLSSDGMYRQRLGLRLSWISATRTPTNGLNDADSERSQLSTMVESEQNVMLDSFNLGSSQMVCANLDATSAAFSSSLRIW